MQLANPEPRQVNICDGSSSVSPNIINNIIQKYDVVWLFFMFWKMINSVKNLKYELYFSKSLFINLPR